MKNPQNKGIIYAYYPYFEGFLFLLHRKRYVVARCPPLGSLPTEIKMKERQMQEKLFAISDEIDGQDIKNIRKKLALTQAEFAQLANVSQKTVERWETAGSPIKGAIVTLVKLLGEYPEMADRLRIPEKQYPMRLWYMFKNEICTIIDVDEGRRKVSIVNFTDQYLFRAFGRNERPSFEEYEAFLESRCFPRSRDKLKLILKDLGLPFYDPIMIIEKTEGRMAEDDFWLRIER